MTFAVMTTHLESGCTVYTQIQGNTIGTLWLIVPTQEYVNYIVLKYFLRLVKIYTLHKSLFYGHKHIRLKFGGATFPGGLADFDCGSEASIRLPCRKLISRRSRRDFFLQGANISPHLSSQKILILIKLPTPTFSSKFR